MPVDLVLKGCLYVLLNRATQCSRLASLSAGSLSMREESEALSSSRQSPLQYGDAFASGNPVVWLWVKTKMSGARTIGVTHLVEVKD